MILRNGDYPKAKWKFLRERFMTKEGRFDLFVGTAIWGFIVVTFNQILWEFLLGIFEFISIQVIQFYLAYFTLGITYTVMGIFITQLVNYLYETLLRFVKNGKK